MNVALIWSLPASFEEKVLTAKTKIRIKPARRKVSALTSGAFSWSKSSLVSMKSDLKECINLRKKLEVTQARTEVIAGV